MTRLSRLKGRGVVAADQAATVGRVAGVVIDPALGVVVALRIDGAHGGDTLHWPDIAGLRARRGDGGVRGGGPGGGGPGRGAARR